MEEDKKDKADDSRASAAEKWPQIIAAISTCIGALGHGCGMGWTSPVLPVLTDCENNPAKPDGCAFDHEFTDSQGTWIGSVYTLGALVSGFATGYCLVRVGRKWTMLVMAVPYAAGWVLLSLTYPLKLDSPTWFYIGRALTGFGGGSFALAAPYYISEISEVRLRGSLGSMMQLFLTTGIVYINAVGSVLRPDILTSTVIAFPVLMAVCMFFMPETPFYLLLKQKYEKSNKSLQWLRGKRCNIHEEFQALEATVDEQRHLGHVSLRELCTRKVYARPMLLMLALHFFQQFCGINAIVFYLTDIFLKAGFDMDNSLLEAAIVSMTQVLATFTAILIVDRVGRKILLVVSSTVMCFSILALGLFFYFDAHTEELCYVSLTPFINQTEPTTLGHSSTTEVYDCEVQEGYSQEFVDSIGWLPLVSLIVYKFFFSIGYGPLPWMMNGEFFPLEAKAKAASIATAFNWACAFIVSKFEENLESAIGTYGAYFLFSGVCAVATIFVILFIPETRGKSAEDMKQLFEHGSWMVLKKKRT